MPIHVDYILYIEDIPAECIRDCSAQDDVSDSVEYWRNELEFTVDRDNAIACLYHYGAWEAEELAAMDDSDIAAKVLWLACCNFKEYRASLDYGSDIFVLE